MREEGERENERDAWDQKPGRCQLGRLRQTMRVRYIEIRKVISPKAKKIGNENHVT